MVTVLGTGTIQFGDGTVLSSGNITSAQINTIPTLLTQFTNDLGNYGWMNTSNLLVGGPFNGIPYRNGSGFALAYSGSNFGIYCTNCNCNCNC